MDYTAAKYGLMVIYLIYLVCAVAVTSEGGDLRGLLIGLSFGILGTLLAQFVMGGFGV